MPRDPVMVHLRTGIAIPASPLALTNERKFDERRQRALYRYYMDAGSGGVAVAVHTTQFEIREPRHGLFEPVLRLAAECLREPRAGVDVNALVRISGVCGHTDQAVREASLAAELNYDAVLLSLAALKNASDDELIAHCSTVADIMPLIGFYLQPAVGGRVLPYTFWRRFAGIKNVIAVKIAPFNRYQTLEVVRAIFDSGRGKEICLYTGNDDNIIPDLITPFNLRSAEGFIESLHIVGGLLGQFSVWTKTAVEMVREARAVGHCASEKYHDLLGRGVQLTDANAAVFDAANQFAGCIPGINEVLRRQGLLANNYCLNPHEVLSPGQAEELDRVNKAYKWLVDDEFVQEHLDEWMR
ncbi:MAG: dihydrodipicolinate synthase family protein [Candidatus Sumerlaeaceae bacterium]